MAGTVVIVSPWIGYNLSRFEDPVFLSTSDGPALAGTNCDPVYSGPLIGFYSATCLPAFPGDESVQDRLYRSRGFTYLGDHLGQIPRVVAARVGRQWGVFRPVQMARISQFDGRPLSASMFGWAMSWPLIGLGIAGAVWLRQRPVTLVPLLAPIVVVTLNAAALYGNNRFRGPAEASIVVLAAIGVTAVIDRRPMPASDSLVRSAGRA
jgi:hypothetical protein